MIMPRQATPFPETDVALKATVEVRPLTRLPPSGKNRISDAAAGEVGGAGGGEVEDVGEGEGVSEVEYRVLCMVNGCIK